MKRPFEILSPMAEKKFLVGWQESFCSADDRTQGGSHLDGNQDKNNNPGVQAGHGAGLGVRERVLQETQSKDRRDEPERQMQSAHPNKRIGVLRKKPSHRGEA